MVELPNQRVSRSAKEQDDFYKPTYDYLVNKAISLNSKDDLKIWLDAANGVISNESIKYLISPIIDTETKKTIGKLPGEIRDTDLINTIRERNIGEYIGLPYKFTVDVFNSDSILKRDAEVNEQVGKLMQQALINMLNEYYGKLAEQGKTAPETGVQNAEVPDIEKFAKDFIEKWIDSRAIQGKHILNLINEVNDFDTKRLQSFFYWWACEEFYTYREIINNEVYTSLISPLEGYPIYNDEQFVEDFTGFVIRKRNTLTKIKQLYWNEFSEIEKKYLESLTNNAGTYTVNSEWLASRTWDTSLRDEYKMNPNFSYDITDKHEAIDEYTIIWRTEVPIKIRIFLDVFGNRLEEVVSEDYIINPEIDIEVKEEWIEEIYIGKRFGDATKGVYLKPKPCDVQRYDKHTMSPKLPVGGKKGILRNIAQNPIPKRLISFTIIDRMILLLQERTMAKYQGYLQIIPQSMLNDDSTGTKNEKIFYMKADNTLVYDDTSVDFNTVAQGFRVIGMPAIEQYLKVLIELRDKNKNEALEMANMNQYRLGDVMASTGKGVMEESIYRAALGNVLAITMFHAALERDHMADIEFSKIAYQDEKRGSYLDKTNNKHIYIDINLKEHRETDYGVYVENSKVDKEKIDMFRKLAFNASQNGDIDAAVAAVELDSVPELRQSLKEISKANKEFEVAMQEQQSATQKYVADQQTARQDSINDTARYVVDKQSETAIIIADMKLEDEIDTTEPNLDTNDKDGATSLRRDELEFKRNDSNIKNDLKRRQLYNTDRLNREKLKLSSKMKTTK